MESDINRHGTTAPPMLNSTRTMLSAFYAPYNARLAAMSPELDHVMGRQRGEGRGQAARRAPPPWLAPS